MGNGYPSNPSDLDRVSGNDKQYVFNSEDDTWKNHGSVSNYPIVGRENDGLVSPSLFDRLIQINESLDGLSDLKLTPDKTYFYYFISTDRFISFNIEHNHLIIEANKGLINRRLASFPCRGSRGANGSKGPRGRNGVPASSEKLRPIYQNGSFEVDVNTPIDQPISLRGFDYGDQIFEAIINLNGNVEDKDNGVSDIQLIGNPSSGKVIVKGKLNDTSLRFKIRQFGPKGKSGSDGVNYVQVKTDEAPTNGQFTEVVGMLRYNPTLNSLIIKKTPINELLNNVINVTPRTDLPTGDVWAAVEIASRPRKSVEYHQFLPAIAKPKINLPNYTPLSGCYNQNRYSLGYLQPDSSIPFTIIGDPFPEYRNCKEPFWFCGNTGDTCDDLIDVDPKELNPPFDTSSSSGSTSSSSSISSPSSELTSITSVSNSTDESQSTQSLSTNESLSTNTSLSTDASLSTQESLSTNTSLSDGDGDDLSEASEESPSTESTQSTDSSISDGLGDGECCQTIWTSTYNCFDDTWSDPNGLSGEVPSGGNPCGSDSGWSYGGIGPDPCGAVRVIITGAPCGETSPPSKPTLPEPPGCCGEVGGDCVYTWQSEYICCNDPDGQTGVWEEPVLLGSDCGDSGSANTSWTLVGGLFAQIQTIGSSCTSSGDCSSPVSPSDPNESGLVPSDCDCAFTTFCVVVSGTSGPNIDDNYGEGDRGVQGCDGWEFYSFPPASGSDVLIQILVQWDGVDGSTASISANYFGGGDPGNEYESLNESTTATITCVNGVPSFTANILGGTISTVDCCATDCSCPQNDMTLTGGAGPCDISGSWEWYTSHGWSNNGGAGNAVLVNPNNNTAQLLQGGVATHSGSITYSCGDDGVISVSGVLNGLDTVEGDCTGGTVTISV